MKCPHCEYIDGWNPDTGGGRKGKLGKFYRLSNDIYIQRIVKSVGENKRVLGCPKCNKLFMA